MKVYHMSLCKGLKTLKPMKPAHTGRPKGVYATNLESLHIWMIIITPQCRYFECGKGRKYCNICVCYRPPIYVYEIDLPDNMMVKSQLYSVINMDYESMLARNLENYWSVEKFIEPEVLISEEVKCNLFGVIEDYDDEKGEIIWSHTPRLR